jgi:hypothetical protein
MTVFKAPIYDIIFITLGINHGFASVPYPIPGYVLDLTCKLIKCPYFFGDKNAKELLNIAQPTEGQFYSLQDWYPRLGCNSLSR